MALIKMGAAARRAGAGSTNTIRRALNAAGIRLVTLSPGTFAVEEEDLNRFLQNRKVDNFAGEFPGKSANPPTKTGKAKLRKIDKRRSR